ncbi:MAG: type II toxin-antitoxin system VapC family toxin [Thermoanaerobaculia bacterium]
MKILLDTSAYSAFMRGHEGVLDFVQRAERIAVTPIVLGELLSGFRLGKRTRKNHDLLNRFLGSTRVESLPIDDGTARRYSDIVEHLRSEGTPIPTNDLWIAASAMQHGLIVVSTDTHFDKVPQISKEILPVS